MTAKQTVSREEILKIARLAKLHMDDERCENYTQQLNAILDHIHKLEGLDLTGVEPLSHVLEIMNVARADESAESLPRDRVLANAPPIDMDHPEKRATDGEFFLVPQVIKTDQ
jgi:aspartyl-tRNA(Asn)/glutamyl-tRNA(Gln) amidotransferase subunit C